MGSPQFAVPALRSLVEAGYRVCAVVTQPDRPAGRGGARRVPAVKLAAVEASITTFQPESLRGPELREALAALEPDLFVVAAYGKILPRAVLVIPRRGSVNVHASLLARWRGASPIASAILAGDRETGVSIMEMSAKMDAGPVIARSSTPVRDDDTTETLGARLAELGAQLLVDVLPAWYEGRLVAKPQDEALATYCPLLRKADGQLKANMTPAEGERAVRAYNPWPGCFISYRGERLAIWRAHAEEALEIPPPGTTVLLGKLPAVALRGGLLVLDEVQRTGSRRLSGHDFVNGERGVLAATMGLA